MLITLPNILSTIFAILSVPKFWTWPSVVGIVATNTGVNFAILWVLIVISLSVNFVKDLVYKVLNIGVLSILIAVTWAFLSSILFIYVAYILAFLGAVVMLFLSVVLMLPRSAIASVGDIKTSVAPIFLASLEHQMPSPLVIGVWVFLFIMLVCWFVHVHKVLEKRAVESSIVYPSIAIEPKPLETGANPKYIAPWEAACFARYAQRFTMLVYQSSEFNKLALSYFVINQGVRSRKPPHCVVPFVKSGVTFGDPSRKGFSPLLILSVPKFYKIRGNNTVASFLLFVAY